MIADLSNLYKEILYEYLDEGLKNIRKTANGLLTIIIVDNPKTVQFGFYYNGIKNAAKDIYDYLKSKKILSGFKDYIVIEHISNINNVFTNYYVINHNTFITRNNKITIQNNKSSTMLTLLSKNEIIDTLFKTQAPILPKQEVRFLQNSINDPNLKEVIFNNIRFHTTQNTFFNTNINSITFEGDIKDPPHINIYHRNINSFDNYLFNYNKSNVLFIDFNFIRVINHFVRDELGLVLKKFNISNMLEIGYRYESNIIKGSVFMMDSIFYIFSTNILFFKIKNIDISDIIYSNDMVKEYISRYLLYIFSSMIIDIKSNMRIFNFKVVETQNNDIPEYMCLYRFYTAMLEYFRYFNLNEIPLVECV